MVVNRNAVITVTVHVKGHAIMHVTILVLMIAIQVVLVVHPLVPSV